MPNGPQTLENAEGGARRPPRDVFELRCEARAILVDNGWMTLQEALGGLQEFVVSSRLVDLVGHDTVQEIITREFGRRPKRQMFEDSGAGGRPLHGVSQHRDRDARPDTWPNASTDDGVSPKLSLIAPSQIRFTPFTKIQLSTSPRYLVKGLIPNVGLVVVWGAPKCGKSFFVFDLVSHVAAGWEYRGRKVQQCPVVYFALEGQEEESTLA